MTNKGRIWYNVTWNLLWRTKEAKDATKKS
jgi:hypothetical protein